MTNDGSSQWKLPGQWQAAGKSCLLREDVSHAAVLDTNVQEERMGAGAETLKCIAVALAVLVGMKMDHIPTQHTCRVKVSSLFCHRVWHSQ